MNRCRQALAALTAMIGLLIFAPLPVAAHTDFESSDPADGAIVTESVTMITVTFTKPVTLNGPGFEMLVSDGQIVEPKVTSVDGGTTWTLGLDSPLEPGDVAVRYNVAAEDGHPVDGGFAFLVEGDLQTSPPSNETTSSTIATTSTVEEFLPAGDTSRAQLIVSIGRVLGIGGSLLVIGILAFAMVCLPEKRPTELLETLLIISGLIIVVGAVTEASGLSTVLDLPFIEVLTDRRLDGARVRAVAGTVLAFGALAPIGWRQLPLLAGAALSATSFALDGHSVSEGPRVVMAATNLAHVSAAGVWTGGTLGLLVTLIQRGHADSTTNTGTIEVTNRFASLATAVLAPVLVSGAVMAFLILDRWSELFATSWGRLLLLKMLAVAAALVIGAHHHFRVVPRLAQRPARLVTFRRTVTIEVAVFGAIAVVTAFLVSASVN